MQYRLATKEENLAVCERVKSHMLTQGEKSQVFDSPCNPRCLYRAGELSCAAGCLIADEYYDTGLENLPADSPRVQSAIIDSLGFVPNMEMVRSLQVIHDDWPVDEWESVLDQKIREWEAVL